MKSTKGTKTLTIGALGLRLTTNDVYKHSFTVAHAFDFEVEVEYSYQPGLPNQIHGAFENAEEGYDEELSIKAVKNTAALHFVCEFGEVVFNRGANIIALFSHVEMCSLEDRVLAEIKQHE